MTKQARDLSTIAAVESAAWQSLSVMFRGSSVVSELLVWFPKLEFSNMLVSKGKSLVMRSYLLRFLLL